MNPGRITRLGLIVVSPLLLIVGCVPQPPPPPATGLTVELSGCPTEVEQGGSIMITAMTTDDATGGDVTANASYSYVVTQGATSIGISGQANVGTANVPTDAEVGAYVLTVTASLDGETDSAECRFDIIAEDTPPPGRELAYVGSDRCAACHGDIYDIFRNSGHPYKINKIENNMVPTYPFSTIAGALALIDDDDLPGPDEGDAADPNLDNTDNQLGTPESYADISYVIGGFGWKARWIDNDGYIVTGSDVQYNLETEAMSAYHNNETDKVFNCGNCHTTGWKRYTSEEGDDRNLNRQDDLPGMDGTFALPGIQCESCHGAGSEHVAAPSSSNIVRVAQPRTTADFLAEDMAFGKAVACSDCHTRHAEKDYPSYVGGVGLILASGGLIRHHEQNDEMLGINPDDPDGGPTGPHASFACTVCHDPHSTTRYQAISGDPPGVSTECTSCHAASEYEITSGGMQGLACTDCHMPLLAKSAISHAAIGTGPKTGDIKTHIFRIDLTATQQFTEDGKFAYPSITGAFACNTCHNGEDSFDITFPNNMTIHD